MADADPARLPPFDAVVLAGGSARRLGGVDKPALDVAGTTLLDRALAAVADAGRTVVVGPHRPVSRPVEWTREEPPGGGPAAGLAAGLRLVQAAWVAVVAADLPLLTARVVCALRAAAPGSDGALLVDDTGHDQWLTGVWATGPLRSAAQDAGSGTRLGAVLGRLDAVRVPLAAIGLDQWFDCDTEDDLRRAREIS